MNAFVLAAIAAFCGGSVPVFGKVALEVFHPFTVITLRFFLATLFIFPFVYKRRELKVHFFSQLFTVALLGALNPMLFFLALPFVKASVTPLIYACVPAFTAMYLFGAQHKKVTQRQQIGIVVGFVGVAIVILLPLMEKGVRFADLLGNVVLFIAAFAFMLYGIMSKKRQQEIGASPLALTFYFCLVTLLASLPFTARELLTSGISTSIGLHHIASVLEVGIVGTGFLYLSYQYALQKSSEVAASLFTYLQPITTVGLAAVFLGEQVTIPFIIGGILAVVGARIAA